MRLNDPYHEGELEVQRRADATQVARINGNTIRDCIPDGATRFIAQQPMVVIGSIDPGGDVRASVVFGMPGFLQVRDNRTLVMGRSQYYLAEDDLLWDRLEVNPQAGLLVIELGSRRRLRINGRFRRSLDGDFFIDVERVYPNCPKYIQRRHWKIPAVDVSRTVAPGRHGAQLNDFQQSWIRRADTFFVASAHPAHGVDVSHRGGRPGFIQVSGPRKLRIPDFSGNSMYNTLGNFTSYPHVGLIFLDFDHGRILQLVGRPEILWQQDNADSGIDGVLRYWEVEVTAWQESDLPFQIEWELIDYSPFIPVPKSSPAAESPVLQLQVNHIQDETEHIKWYRMSAADGGVLPSFDPGAHLPVSVRTANGKWELRNYSILSDPADRMQYEIAVLAEPRGRGGSLYLHDCVNAGDTLAASHPENGFAMDMGANHSILIAGGIGITPLLCMLRTLKAEGKSFELHYSARRWSDLAFSAIIEDVAGKQAHLYASHEPDGGRIDLDKLLAVPKPGVHVYICGPGKMLLAARELALENNWPIDQVHIESFGEAASAEKRALTIILAKSATTLSVPASRSILDVLLGAGIAVPHDCKRGECAMCLTRVLNGEPEHRDLCLTSEERSSSMCVCVSRAKSKVLTLDL